MKKIFLNYAIEDLEFVKKLILHLRRFCIVWSDRDIIAGEVTETVVKNNWESSDFILEVISADFINKDHLHRDLKPNQVLIPLYYRSCSLDEDRWQNYFPIEPINSSTNFDQIMLESITYIKELVK